MAFNPSVIAALEAGLVATPDDVALRLYLTDLLVQSAEWDRAWGHCAFLLARQPDSTDVLTLAAAVAEGQGNTEGAAAYRRLLDALEPSTSVEAATAASLPASKQEDESASVLAEGDDDYDAFLREVLAEADVDIESPSVLLADVGGLDDVKHRLETSFLVPMRNPELREMYGKSLRGGLLLYGPPGCGKTFLARAVAGELGAHFFAVGLTDVLDMWLGQSERNLHLVFERARRSTPCVLFLDEVDALGQKRSNLTKSAGRNVVVQLLAEMDGVLANNDGVFVLAATNQPWDIDPALRRPGRLDRMLLVLPPDEKARVAILDHHLAGRPVADLDLVRVARATDGFSGADLSMLCEAGAEAALVDSVESGIARPIGTEDLLRALQDVKSSTRPWFDVAKNYALFANSDGTYDDLLGYMRHHRMD